MFSEPSANDFLDVLGGRSKIQVDHYKNF